MYDQAAQLMTLPARGEGCEEAGEAAGSARGRAFGRPSFEAGVVSRLECLELWVGELGGQAAGDPLLCCRQDTVLARSGVTAGLGEAETRERVG